MRTLRRALGLAFIGVGILHFARPKFFLSIMPSWIPLHREAVAVSGAAEIAGGVAMLPDRTASLAAPWLVALLVAVFPANVNMAIDQQQIEQAKASGIPSGRSGPDCRSSRCSCTWSGSQPARRTDDGSRPEEVLEALLELLPGLILELLALLFRDDLVEVISGALRQSAFEGIPEAAERIV